MINFVGAGAIIILVLFIIVAAISSIKSRNETIQRMTNAGFGYCGYLNSIAQYLWAYNGGVYIGDTVENLVAIEVISLSEITKGAKLHELEIRYRINGEVKSARVRDSGDKLLTYMDRLGYS